jgi:hypothetical protein
MRLTLNSDGSGAGQTVTGTGNKTVYLVVEGNPSTTNSRIATITAGGIVKVIVTQDMYIPGGFSERISWNATAFGSGTYILTTNYTDAGLYFKFGSVTGIFSGSGSSNQILPATNASTFNAATHIAWSPVAVAGTGQTAWDAVPYVVSAHTTTINDAFHTLANVQAGLGDPCRLVGLDLAAIKNGTSTIIDNNIWRLPTTLENTQFTSCASGTGHWWTGSGGANPSPFGLVPGSEFPARNSGPGGHPNPASFMPANGWRSSIGQATSGQGRYWGSGTAPNNPQLQSYGLGFNSGSVSYQQNYNRELGFGIRCVSR